MVPFVGMVDRRRLAPGLGGRPHPRPNPLAVGGGGGRDGSVGQGGNVAPLVRRDPGVVAVNLILVASEGGTVGVKTGNLREGDTLYKWKTCAQLIYVFLPSLAACEFVNKL
jgi:hypothetical protein